MLRKFLIGFIGGIIGVLSIWSAAWLGIINWVEKGKLTETTANSVLGAFSLLAVFIFVTFYFFYKSQTISKEPKTFKNLFIIGFSFCVGASTTLAPLLYLDNMERLHIYAFTTYFGLACLFIMLLVCSFYLFIMPSSSNPKKELLDEVFSDL